MNDCNGNDHVLGFRCSYIIRNINVVRSSEDTPYITKSVYWMNVLPSLLIFVTFYLYLSPFYISAQTTRFLWFIYFIQLFDTLWPRNNCLHTSLNRERWKWLKIFRHLSRRQNEMEKLIKCLKTHWHDRNEAVTISSSNKIIFVFLHCVGELVCWQNK